MSSLSLNLNDGNGGKHFNGDHGRIPRIWKAKSSQAVCGGEVPQNSAAENDKVTRRNVPTIQVSDLSAHSVASVESCKLRESPLGNRPTIAVERQHRKDADEQILQMFNALMKSNSEIHNVQNKNQERIEKLISEQSIMLQQQDSQLANVKEHMNEVDKSVVITREGLTQAKLEVTKLAERILECERKLAANSSSIDAGMKSSITSSPLSTMCMEKQSTSDLMSSCEQGTFPKSTCNDELERRTLLTLIPQEIDLSEKKNASAVHETSKPSRDCAKIPDFDGSSDVMAYIHHVRRIQKYNGWNDERTYFALISALKGPAAAVTSKLGAGEAIDTSRVLQALNDRFANANKREEAIAKLNTLTQKQGESLRELSLQVETTVHFAYPLADRQTSQDICVREFTRAIWNEEIRKSVAMARPRDLQAAVVTAEHTESVLKFVISPRDRRPTITSVSEPILDDGKLKNLENRLMRLEDNQSRTKEPKKVNPWQESAMSDRTPSSASQRPAGCYNCGSKGHLVAMCPNQRSQSGDKWRRSYNPVDNSGDSAWSKGNGKPQPAMGGSMRE